MSGRRLQRLRGACCLLLVGVLTLAGCAPGVSPLPRPRRPPPGPTPPLRLVEVGWDDGELSRRWALAGDLVFVGPEGRIPLMYQGQARINGTTKGRLSRVDSKVVAVDISGLKASVAAALLGRHRATLQTVVWRDLRRLEPEVMAALGRLASPRLVLSLWPADAVDESPDLRPLGQLSARLGGLELGIEQAPGGLASLPQLDGLETLYLRTSVGAVDLVALRRFGRLRVLSLRNALVGFAVPPAALGTLAALPRLAWLDLSVNRLDDRALPWLRACAALRGLDLSDNRLTGRALGELRHLTRLGHLELGGNPLRRAGLASLTKVPGLEVLGLAGTATSDAELVALATLKRLRGLDLAGTLVGDAGLAVVGRLPALRQLDLRRTRVSEAAVWGFQRKHPNCRLLRSLPRESDGAPKSLGLDAFAPCRRYLKIFECMVRRMPKSAQPAARAALRQALSTWGKKIKGATTTAARVAVLKACQKGLDALRRLRNTSMMRGCISP